MKIEIFELEYLQFILSNIWYFIGFCVILFIVTTNVKRIVVNFLFTIHGYITQFITSVKTRYRELNLSDKVNKPKGG